MTTSFGTKWVAIFAATSMLALPGMAAPQAMPTPPQQQAPATQSAPQSTAPSAQAPNTPDTQSPAQSTAAPQDMTTTTSQPTGSVITSTSTPDNTDVAPAAPDPKAPTKVKPGSGADVNAIGNRNVGKGLDFYSIQHEIEIGKELSQEVEKTAKFINDPVVVEYVNRVGQNLVRNSDAQVPFTIKVID